MKTNNLVKRIISVMALMLAVMMLFTACGGGEETSSTASTESKQEAQGDNNNTEDTSAPDVTDPIDTSSSASTNQGNGNAGNNNNTGTAEPAPGWGKAPSGEVHVLMWRDYTKTEKSLVDSYTKKTGVKIRTTVTTETEMPTKLVSLVSGGDSPDVVCIDARRFPGLVVKSMQPLDEKIFRLNDDCWYKGYMDAAKINGKYFGVAMAKAWNCEDCAYVTYYNPAVLKQCGITDMPYKLYTQGKWNWQKQAEYAKQIVRFGKGNYTGLSLHDNGVIMHSAGTDFVKYDGKKFTNNLASVNAGSMLAKAWKEVAQLNQDGLLSKWDLNNVQQGKVGLFTSICYGLYNEGAWFDNVTGGAASLQAVPVAGPTGGTAYTPVRPKVWGVAKRAKNPEGAAYFLRYWLDVNNFNLSSTFYNKQFETVYNKVTDKNAKKSIIYGEGICDYVKANTYTDMMYQLGGSTPANVTTVLGRNKGTVATNVAKANKDLAKIR